MAKTKTPFFSLGASGSVGGSITAQKRASLTLIRNKPLPTYRRTLPQAYQRWLYQDYAYLWLQQTTATKAQYDAAGSRHHLTGFQYWMKVMLSTLPGILGIWHFDYTSAGITPDSSPYGNNAQVLGPSPATGPIGGALYFDGLNDKTVIPTKPHLQNLTAKTLMMFARITPFTGVRRHIYNGRYWDAPYGDIWELRFNSNYIYTRWRNTTGATAWKAILYTPNIWTLFTATWDGTNIRSYRNDALVAGPSAFTGILASSFGDLILGCLTVSEWADCYIDNVIEWDRALDQTEIARWALRRYP